ncbi:tellurite resistance TerB C-terminal domain-containing protein [Catellatospora coxensis]
MAVPPPAANPAVSPARPVTAGPAADRRHRAVPGLDAEVLAAKLHETASVAALLTSIFAEHDAQPAVAARPVAPAPAAVPDVAVPLAGLDAAHAALLTELLTRPSWPRAEFDRLAARHGLMPERSRSSTRPRTKRSTTRSSTATTSL